MKIEADRDEIARFVGALFQHADTDTFVSLRAFRDDADGAWGYEHWSTVRINGDGFGALVDAAFALASACAAAAKAVVFAPPIATFNNADKADAGSLANGLVITVEIDADPAAAREKLEAVLGTPTIAMQSGGLWIDQATGEPCPKQHVHWRLAQPTRTPIEHDFLREINRLATTLAGGDPSGIALVHPLRWPGSLHRKATPRLARIVAYNPEVEITLADALAKLRAAVEAPRHATGRKRANDHDRTAWRPTVINGGANGDGRPAHAELFDICAALAVIPNDDSGSPQDCWNRWNEMGLRIYAALGDNDEAEALFVGWSRRCKAKFDEDNTRARWRHYATSPPTRTGPDAIFKMAREEWPNFVRPSEYARAARQDASLAEFETRIGPATSENIEPNPAGPEPQSPRGNGHDPEAEAGSTNPKVVDDYDTDTSWATPAPTGEPWPEIASEAFHGLAGEVVDTLAPETEADPVALLMMFLAEAGNQFGRGPFFQVGSKKHYLNLYELLVGETAKARKGTAAADVQAILELADEAWQIQTGLSSGEGVIEAVHDDVFVRHPVKVGKGDDATFEYRTVLKDPSVADKRLMIIEEEFGGALEVMRREGSILSRVLRDAWDGRKLVTMTKHSPTRATGAHVSIVGHITRDELSGTLDRTSMFNGYANRFLFACIKRAQLLPFGGEVDPAALDRFARRLREIREAAQQGRALARRITFHRDTRPIWEAEYARLAKAPPGLLGAVTARAEAQTAKLATLFTVLDFSAYIEPKHLAAALAVWRYCEASAKYIFRDATGNPIADDIMRALRNHGSDGMTRTQISEHFGNNRAADKIGAALAFLLSHGKARCVKRPRAGGGPGRGVEVWVAC